MHEHAAVGVDPVTGKITRFDAEYSGDDDEEEVRLLKPTQFLVPGLVDTHIHAPQFAYAGTATDVPLMRWLEVGGLDACMRKRERGEVERQDVSACVSCPYVPPTYVTTHNLMTGVHLPERNAAENRHGPRPQGIRAHTGVRGGAWDDHG